jgi:hypothetical protein
MADLLVHYALGHTGGTFISDPRVRVLFYAGNLLPDVIFKTFLYLTRSSTWYCEPSHSPLMLVPICLFLSHLFEERIRAPAFWALLVGCYLHVGLDVFKNYMGCGVILWAFPFSMDRVEVGWYYSEQTLYLMGPAVLLILLSELIARVRSGRLRSP